MTTSSTPFLGCKISLISKSEIRYEGILYTIDPKESTIALAKVRSYGTEDRPAERQIPPRDEVYEYIIFRANDIKDLIVDDPPVTSGLSDPAIIQAHSMSGSSASNIPTKGIGNVPHAIPTTAAPQPVQAVGPCAPVPGQFGGSSTGSRSAASSPQPPRRSPIQDSGLMRTTPVRKEKDKREYSRPSYQHNQHNQQNRIGGGGGGGGDRVERRQFQRRPPQNYQQQNAQRPPANYNSNQRGRPGPGQGFQRRTPMVTRPPPQPRAQTTKGPNRGVKAEPLKFDGDYDFDKANQEFQELESKLAALKVEEKKNGETDTEKEPEKEVVEKTDDAKKDDVENQYYDKTKSFFDQISCEGIERSRGVHRMDWRQERKLNTETFGTSNYRRQGGLRGRGNNRSRNYGYGSNPGRMGAGRPMTIHGQQENNGSRGGQHSFAS